MQRSRVGSGCTCVDTSAETPRLCGYGSDRNISNNLADIAIDSMYKLIKTKLKCDNSNVELKLFFQIFKDIGFQFYFKYIAICAKFELNISYDLRNSFCQYFENIEIKNYKFKGNVSDIIRLINLYFNAYKNMMQLLRFSYKRFIKIKDINALRDCVLKIDS